VLTSQAASTSLRACVLQVLAPREASAPQSDEDRQAALTLQLRELMDGGMSASSAAKLISKNTGARKSEVYALAVNLGKASAKGSTDQQ
jgi:16S rRNA C1402 (ribose-2'-O) methylase RsmI